MAKSKAQQALDLALELFLTHPPWTRLYNAIFGNDGMTKQLFPAESDRVKFAQTPQYAEIWRLIEQLQNKDNDASGTLSLRLPKSLHHALKVEAEAEGVSINQLATAKLAASLSAVVR